MVKAFVLFIVVVLTIKVIKSCTEPDPVFADGTASSESRFIDSTTVADSVFTYIFLMRLEHPDIVMAQCIEESGNFSSPLFLHGHNCTGMRVPAQRPTLALGMLYNHARFRSWKDCIADYAIWQSIYARGLSKDDYFAYLDRVYAEKKGYSGRLKNIIKSRGL
jgi:hypothetical protein